MLDAEDDLVAVPGLRGEALLQEIRGALGVGVGDREVVGVFRAGRLREAVDEHDQEDPADYDVQAMGCGPAGEL